MPYINGVYMSAPGTSVVVNDQGFSGQTNVGGLGVIFIGPATDGQPNTQLTLSSPGQAVSVLKGGDLLQAVLNAFDGAGTSGPSQLVAIRPELATQATSSINNGSAVAQIALTTMSYGTIANSSKWQVQAGTTAGYKVSQATDFVGPGSQTYPTSSQDNIALPVFNVYYTGADTNVTITITDTTLTINGTTTPTIATITLDSSTTVQQLVNQINQLLGFTATVLDPNTQDPTGALFDNVSAVVVSLLSATPTVFSANVTAAVRWFNQQNAYFTATRQTGATSLATAGTWTYATGGTTPSAANSDWQNAYTTAQSITGVQLIAPVSSSESMWVMNDTHCHYMASIGQPRRGYVGDTTGQTIATETSYASSINSNRTTIVWPEQKGVDYNGNQTTFAPYLVAAKLMGMRAATPASQSLTLHTVNSNGMGQTVAPSTVSTALNGGVCVLYTDDTGKVVVSHDRTTWLQNTNYDKVENSTGLVADIITTDLNQILKTYVSQPMTVITVGGAKAAVLSRLTYWYDRGYLAAKPQSSDVNMQGSGDQISGTAQAAFDVPVNYIVLSITPTTVSVSA